MKNGRPLKFKTAEELQEKIDQYFKEECKVVAITDKDGNALTDKRGKPVVEVNPPTVSGLARYLGFLDRQSMYDYKKRDDFSCTIKDATLRIEAFAEKQLFVGNSTGAIFWLKNKGWKDKTEQEVTVTSLSEKKKSQIKDLLKKL